MVSHSYLGLSLSSVLTESLDRAVTVAGSAEDSKLREAGTLLGLLRRSWLGKNKVWNLKAGGVPRPSCGTASQRDGVVPAIQDIPGWLHSISETALHHFMALPSAQHSPGHKDVVFMSSFPSEVTKLCQIRLFRDPSVSNPASSIVKSQHWSHPQHLLASEGCT